MRELQYILSRPHGVVRAREVDKSALWRATRAGILVRRYHGVYTGPNPTREGAWLAAVYAAGEKAALASLNAAVMHDASRFRPSGITVAVPTRRRPRGVKVIPGLDPRDIRKRNGIPVTSIERTLIDLTDVLWPEQIANVIHEAAFRRLYSEAATRRVMARTPRRRIRRLERAMALWAQGSAGTRSDLEDRFMALVRGARLPIPVVNTHVHGVEVDFRWGRYCVEVDGPNHLRPPTRAKDEANEAILRRHDLTVVRFTEADIEREPEAVRRALARGIGGRHGS